ncbi:vanin-like protein 2 [Drosophila grimshawi]|uniref:GH24838 n=1 Tax=Drosophila grimshawi TaxID=7222 RepID=B4JNK9_DROGR|nr:vanin-like protein 2 [Drosophila grimshawi]EDV92302.1 GH24838 [Drosophila grimshawi]
MNNNALFLLLLATLLTGTRQLSLPTDNSYVAGVVEYLVETGTQRERTSKATAGFVKILESSDASDLDIIVFPEYVLNSPEMATFVPSPSQNVTPCISPDYELFMVELSCASRARNIYVAFNVVEKELCGDGVVRSDTLSPCPASGVRLFNTNVVLDRRGQVISRYRKSHLWRREYNSRSLIRQPELSTFETDFGVTFGHFICFDMLFYEPAMQLLIERNVTDIIYTTYWFSELPFLGAIQLQEGWAYANNVNLLAADGSQPAGRTTGSGIYAGRAGRLVAEIYEEPTIKLLKARLPKRPVAGGGPLFEMPPQVVPSFQAQLVTPRFTRLATYRDYNLDIFTTELLEVNFTQITNKTLCHHDFCCTFDAQRRPIGSSADHVAYRYRLGVYRGNDTTFILVDRSEQAVCAIFACLDEQLFSCGRIFPTGTSVANTYYFDRIRIEGVFPGAPRRLIMPSTLDGVMMPLNVAQYNWTETPPAKELKDTRVQMELLSPKNDLLTFGIWANYFTQLPTTHNLDHLQPTPGANSTAPPGTDGGAGRSTIAPAATLCLLLFSLIVQL